MNQLRALLYKDSKEFMRNMSLLTSIAMPIFLALLFSMNQEYVIENVSNDTDAARFITLQLYMIIGITYMAVLMFSIATAMSEDQEKGNLPFFVTNNREFILSIVSKSLLYMIISTVVVLFAIGILGGLRDFSIYEYVGLLNIKIVFTLLGISIGLVIRTVAGMSIFIIPVMILIVMTPLIEFIEALRETILPFAQLTLLYQNIKLFEGELLRGFIGHLIYLVLSIIILIIAYKNRVYKV